jgi:hypothetical protein
MAEISLCVGGRKGAARPGLATKERVVNVIPAAAAMPQEIGEDGSQ